RETEKHDRSDQPLVLDYSGAGAAALGAIRGYYPAPRSERDSLGRFSENARSGCRRRGRGAVGAARNQSCSYAPRAYAAQPCPTPGWRIGAFPLISEKFRGVCEKMRFFCGIKPAGSRPSLRESVVAPPLACPLRPNRREDRAP